MTQVYGIIGYPLGHSLSPYMHSRYAYYLNESQEYHIFECTPDKLEDTVQKLHRNNVQGLNVTLPYKQEIQRFLCDIDDAALKIGAVNTLKYNVNGYAGFNTDYIGLKNSLDSADISLKNHNVLILGAGGAARAVAYLARKEGCNELTILNRTLSNAERICGDFGGRALDYSMIDCLKSHYIVFQATKVGMHPATDEVLPLPDTIYSHFEAAVDLIYNPLETLFLRKSKYLGLKTLNGFKMLIEQGLESRRIWNPSETITDDIKKKVYDECIDYKWS